MTIRLTNRQMAGSDPLFRQACEEIGVFPSRRRYRQFKHQKGAVAETARKLVDNGSEKALQIQAK